MQYSKKTLSEEDKFVSTIDDFKERIQSKQKTLVYIAMGVVLLIVIVVGGMIFVNINNQKAKEYEAEGYKYFYSATKDNASDYYSKALELFKKAYDSKKTAYSLLYIATCYEKLGRFDDAIKSLDELVKNFNDAETLSIGYNKLSAIYIKKGEPQKAIDSLDNITKLKGGVLQDFAYLQSALLLETIGKPDDAKLRYKNLTDKHPNSPFVFLAKKKLEPNK